jgi:predicted GTPase
MSNMINIALFGAVSTGKSTLANTLFVEQYSDMNIKRTTTMPQIYIESNSDILKIELDKIKENNKLINKKYMDATANGHKLNYEQLEEIKYYVPKIHDFVNINENTKLAIYDLPGLNDSMTKQVYYQYVINNIHKFDIIIFVVDIYSALNTSDEVEILKLILNGIKINNIKYNMNTQLIVLLNKCDELYFNETMNKYEPIDDELKEMVVQATNIINHHKNEMFSDANINILCISCEDAYIYRMFSKNSDVKLDVKYINKLGFNEVGKSSWSKFTELEKHEEIRKSISYFEYDDRIKQCGFGQFINLFEELLNDTNQHTYLTNHILYDLIVYIEYSKLNIESNICKQLDKILEFDQIIRNVNINYKISYNYQILKTHVINYLNYYMIY